MDHVPPSRLAELPPIRWEETKQRMKTVSAFLAGGDRSTAAIRRLANELGVSRPMFYKLLRTHEDWRRADAVALRAPRRPWDEAANTIVLEAIAVCGPGATLAEVIRSAERIAHHRNAPPPVMSFVRRVYGRRTAGSAIAQRLSLTTDMVLDSAALGLKVLTDGDRSMLPKLTAVVDLSSGDLVRWRLAPGSPDMEDVVGLVQQAHDVRNGGSLALTSAFGTETKAALLSRTGIPIVESHTIRKGTAITAALGSKIGRIRVLPYADPASPPDGLTSVQFDDLQAVLQVLLPISAAEDGPASADPMSACTSPEA